MEFQSLIDVLYKRNKDTPKATACVFLEGRTATANSLSYQQLHQNATQIAARLQQSGVVVGDRVLLIFSPGLELISAFWGCLYAGAIAVPVFPPSNKKLMEKTHRIIRNSTPKVLLMSKQTLNKYQILFEEGEYLASANESMVLSYESIFIESIYNWLEPSLRSDDIAFLQYTSGSTSYPKGVMISHGNLLDNLEKIKLAFGSGEKSVIFGWLPPYHDMGLIGNILGPIYSAAPTYLMTPFSFLQNPLAWLQHITKYRVTISGSPNFAYDYCIKRIKEHKKEGLDLSSWQLAFNGAEPVHHGTMERFYQAFKDYGFRKEAFLPCYGLAEATLLVSSGKLLKPYKVLHIAKEQFQDHRVQFLAEDNPKSYRLVSSGVVYHDVRIIDPDTLEPCQSDVVGEIWLKSNSVASGYWQQEQETKLAFAANIKGEPKQQNFLRTGDLGFIHDNELYVTGRIKDLIILYGKNHYPQDIEASLAYCDFHAQLGTSAAFVKALENEYYLTVVCEVKNYRLDKKSYESLCNDIFKLIYQEHTLEAHKIVLVKRNNIPQTTSGKVKRSLCRDMLLSNDLETLFTWALARK